MDLTLNEIAAATAGELSGGDPAARVRSLGIDTRALRPGDLFVAIKGAHFDGHDFLDQAAAAGASAAVVERGRAARSVPSVIVEDTLRALGDLAAAWRARFDLPCVAITGSNGKSTTKEMAASVLSQLGPVLKTEGNFNNLVGMPLTALRLSGEHRAAVLEMGMNAAGEIDRLTRIAKPTVGLVTNVTAAHLEKLHTVESVARAKGELFEAMGPGATACVNAEDRWVVEAAARHRGGRITFGMQNDCDVRFLHMETNGLDETRLAVSVMGRELSAVLPLPGSHNVMNALAALAVGAAIGLDEAKSAELLGRFKPMGMRFERIQLSNGARVVNDSYNANPASMKAAFRTVGSAARAGRFILALGDMLELGGQAADLHRQAGEAAREMGADLMFVMGDFASDVAAGAIFAGLPSSSIMVCDDAEQMARLIEEEIKAGDVLLVKGSRGMRMERVVDHLKREIGTG